MVLSSETGGGRSAHRSTALQSGRHTALELAGGNGCKATSSVTAVGLYIATVGTVSFLLSIF